MMARQQRATVKLHDDVVGELRFREDSQAVAFIPARRLAEVDAPVLGQQFIDEPRKIRASHLVAPTWFSNLLPEGPLRSLACRQAGVAEDHEFALLVALGQELPGAVSIAATGVDASEPGLDWPNAEADATAKHAVIPSLSGMQLKLSGSWKDKRLTVAGVGEFGDSIIKLPPSDLLDLAHNEAAMMDWARESGIEVPPTALARIDEIDGLPANFRNSGVTHAYVIKRFDRRSDGGTVHVEDFAQVLDVRPANKYATTFQTIANVALRVAGNSEFEKFILRLIFCAACGNGDGHLKNWCLIYRDGIRPSLAPAYDYVSTVILPGFSDKTNISLLGEKAWARFDRRLFNGLARKLRIDEAVLWRHVTASGDRIWDAWDRVHGTLSVSPSVKGLLSERRNQMPIFRSTPRIAIP